MVQRINYSITLAQLRRARRTLSDKSLVPWADDEDKLLSMMELGNYEMKHLYKYVKNVEDKIIIENKRRATRSHTSTTHYLSQYLDRQKFKKK